ncbi:MAG: N-6 DNA methylase [Coriobacteriales bacterium]|nr:N-6 DNA methylase [Coriobacteriales bacterium]
MLTTTPKASMSVMGTSQLREISGPGLLAIAIPWPKKQVRDAFVAALDEADKHALELDERIPNLLEEGDELFKSIIKSSDDAKVACEEVITWHEGTDVPAQDRDPSKPARIEGPHGKLGCCDEILVDGRVIAVGPAGRRLLAHPVTGPLHPIKEMRYAAEADCQIPFEVAFFALRDAGLFDRLRLRGEQLNAPILAADNLGSVELCIGTPEARAEFAEKAKSIIKAICDTDLESEQAVLDRHAMIRFYYTNETMEGYEATRDELPAKRRDSKTYEKAQRDVAALIEETKKQAAPGLALQSWQKAALGSFAAILADNAFDLSPDDAAWELAPLACIRACASDASWQAIVVAAKEEGAPHLVETLDTCINDLAETDDLLTFLPNLSYQSSLLQPAQIAQWIGELDAIDANTITGSQIRALFALESGCTPLPSEALAIAGSILAALAQKQKTPLEAAYVPTEAASGIIDECSRVLPSVTIRAQFDDFSHMLAAAMVRAVELRNEADTRGGLGASAGNALVTDDFADWNTPLVFAALPANMGDWTEGTKLEKEDPRWMLGVPPRNKSSFAWLEHSLSHMEKGGACVLVVENQILHSSVGSQKNLREALAQSGRVQMVVALPARIWPEHKTARSIIVLGDESADVSCLMVSLLDVAKEAESLGMPGNLRRIPQNVADEVQKICSAWLLDSKVLVTDIPVAAIDAAAIAQHDYSLAPWEYA